MITPSLPTMDAVSWCFLTGTPNQQNLSIAARLLILSALTG